MTNESNTELLKKGDLVMLDEEVIKKAFGQCERFFDLEWSRVYVVAEAYSLVGAESSLLIENSDYGAKFFRRATREEIVASKIAA